MCIILALAAAIGYGASDFSGGLASRRVPVRTTLLVSYLVATLLCLVVAPFAAGAPTLSGAVCAIPAGLCGLVGFGLLYRLVAAAPINVVAPVTGVLAAATPILVGLLGGEQPRRSACLGAGVGLVAIALVAGASGGASLSRVRPGVVLLALLAGLGFGAYFVLVAHAGRTSGLWPLLLARMAALPVLLAARARPGPRRDPRASRLAALAGALDAIADVCFLLATRHGYLSLVGVLAALYPAITALLAVLVLHERPGWLRGAGLGLSVVSLALIAG